MKKKHEKIADGKCLLKNIKNNTNLYKTAVNICENGDDDGDFIRFIAGLYTFIYFRYKFSHNQQLLWAVVCVADRPDRLQNIVSNICKQFAAANGIEVARCIAFLSLSPSRSIYVFNLIVITLGAVLEANAYRYVTRNLLNVQKTELKK